MIKPKYFLGQPVEILYKNKRIPAHIVDMHADGRFTVSWSEQIRITAKPEELKIR